MAGRHRDRDRKELPAAAADREGGVAPGFIMRVRYEEETPGLLEVMDERDIRKSISIILFSPLFWLSSFPNRWWSPDSRRLTIIFIFPFNNNTIIPIRIRWKDDFPTVALFVYHFWLNENCKWDEPPSSNLGDPARACSGGAGSLT